MMAEHRNPPRRAGSHEAREARRRRLAFRAWHRGTREADLLLGSFANAHIALFDDAALDQFEAILAEPDPDLYDWMTRRTAPPVALAGSVMDLLIAHKFKPPS